MRQTVRQDVKDAIQSAVASLLATRHVASCRIEADTDSVGYDAIFVDVKYGLSTTPIDPSDTLTLLREIRNTLFNLGEDRFPYIRHHYAEGQKVKGW